MAAPCKIENIALEMGLTPTDKRPHKWRFGSKGSLVLNLKDDIFYDHEKKTGGGVFQFVIHNGLASNDKEAAQYLKDRGLLDNEEFVKSTKATEARHHIYVDEEGQWLRKATKFSDGQWRQYRFENDMWIAGVKGVRNVPYGLNSLREDYSDKICFVFEGEKDVARAWRNGFLATCNIGGAGKWTDELSEHLTGRTVCIVPDKDDAGQQHAKKVHASLSKINIKCFILWEYQNELEQKGDFSDWMDLNKEDYKKFLDLVEKAVAAPQKKESLFYEKFRLMNAFKLRRWSFNRSSSYVIKSCQASGLPCWLVHQRQESPSKCFAWLWT